MARPLGRAARRPPAGRVGTPCHARPRPGTSWSFGAGIIGLVTAIRLLQRESEIAVHQTGHNSGITPREGPTTRQVRSRQNCASRARLIEFCGRRGIPYRLCGKLVVATREAEPPALDELQRRPRPNGMPGIVQVDRPG